MLKLIFNIRTALAALLLAATPARAADDLQRLASLVDYVAADYAGAVKDGRVVEPTEYEEQRTLLGDALDLARQLPPGSGATAVVDGIARVRAAVERKAPSPEVVAACRAVRTTLVESLGLVVVPAARPSRERARELFAKACVQCHGPEGRGDGPEAARLKPPPLSFHDPERVPKVSPQLAYHALTFGVKDTGMASFDALPAADRWSLAFHVVSLRHAKADLAAGARKFAAARPPVTPSASRLAGLTDEELDALLAPSLPQPTDRTATIAWLRAEATFAAAPGGTFDEARRLLGEIATAPQERRRDLALAAYLDGVEPHEAALRARDADLARRIEAAFLDLRRTIEEGADATALQRHTASLLLLLDRAEERPAGTQVAFLAALTIALREGLEAALLIAALLAFLRTSGRADKARLVHLGWLSSIPLGLALWWIAGALATVVWGARRELVEAVITFVAAAMILTVTHWVLGQREAKHWLGFLRRKIDDTARRESDLALFSLAFVAAGREAFEVVLFYRALLLDSPGERSAVAAGAAAGAVGIVALVVVLGRLGRRLNPRPVMLASSVLLAALAVALVGRGVRALQEGGHLGITPLPIPDLSTIGIYPTLQGLLAQSFMLALILAPSLIERLRRAEPRSLM